jgi:hypothetical protein
MEIAFPHESGCSSELRHEHDRAQLSSGAIPEYTKNFSDGCSPCPTINLGSPYVWDDEMKEWSFRQSKFKRL